MTRSSLTLPMDRDGFVRRACPRCSREFKTRTCDEDSAACSVVLVQRLEHANADELSPYGAGPRCIYCGTKAPAVSLLTPAQRQYLEHMAEYLGQHVQHEQLAQNPQPTYVLVAPDAAPPVPPPELDDLHLVTFLCCGAEAKADSASSRALACPQCGVVEHQRPPRMLGLIVLEA